MEDKIVKSLNNLSVKQIDELKLNYTEKKLTSKEQNRVKKSVYTKIGLKIENKIYVPRKLVACILTLVIVLTTFSFLGFENVAATISKIFTFIPGFGIEEKNDTIFYTIEPIVNKTKANNMIASVIRAVHINNYLSVTVEVVGKAAYHEDFSFYINDELIDHMKDHMFSLAVASDSAMLNFSYKIDVLKDDDIYEIEVNGFPERLSFKMTACIDYEDFKKIGPYDIQNNISITATSQKVDNQLIVWVYPFKTGDAVKDTILAYGKPANGSYNLLRYIETENGKIVENNSGWQLRDRIVLEMPENVLNATLHIPYLSMHRDEKKKLSVKLPNKYTTVESDIIIKCSLGTIKVVEIQREPSETKKDKDKILLKFEFESKDSNRALYSFAYETSNLSVVKQFNGETGCLENLWLEVDKGVNRFSLEITHLSYYLFGEYVIPLDI